MIGQGGSNRRAPPSTEDRRIEDFDPSAARFDNTHGQFSNEQTLYLQCGFAGLIDINQGSEPETPGSIPGCPRRGL